MSEIVARFPYAGLFFLLVLGVIGFPFPEDTTLMLCGFLISQDVVKPVPALVVVFFGILMSDYFLYFMGKKYGRTVVANKRIRKFITPERMSDLEKKFRRRGIIVILLGRHIVGLRAQLFVVAGVTRMPAVKFVLSDAFSAMFTIALMAGAGYLGGYSLQVIERDIRRIEYAAVLLLVISFAIYLLIRYFKIRRGK